MKTPLRTDFPPDRAGKTKWWDAMDDAVAHHLRLALQTVAKERGENYVEVEPYRFKVMIRTLVWGTTLQVQSTGHAMFNPHRLAHNLDHMTNTVRILTEPAPKPKAKESK